MIKVGTSGFSFADWRGVVYPKKFNLRDALYYYQEDLGFDCVEVNSTYYTLVAAGSFAGMERKTGPGFEFVVKAYRGITHDPFDPRLKEKRPDLRKAREDRERFIYSLGPLIDKGKLGAVLLQFPVFFYPSSASREYLEECREAFRHIPLVVEFRSRGWNREESFSFLRKHHLAYCAVDEPHLPRLMPFVNEVTSELAYLRFHGRNREWFNTPVDQRHNYLYSSGELQEFVPEIRMMDKKAEKTYVFFNNCHAGFAPRNALELKKLLHIPVNASLLFSLEPALR